MSGVSMKLPNMKAAPGNSRSRGTAASFSCVFSTKNMPAAFRRPFVASVPLNQSNAAFQQRRFNSEKKEEAKSEEKKEGEESEKKEGEEGEKKEGDEKDGEKKAKKEKPGFFSHFTGFKEDLHRHPDVYNVPNMMNLLLFSIFCLASTGSNVEADWWVNQWGVDGSFQPWTWVLHSWMTNNLPPMAFALMLIHSMAHSIHANPAMGNMGLIRYCGMVSVGSGFAMWAYNAAQGYYASSGNAEKQFGPWDICAALFVMQYLHQGISPITVLAGFQSWLRYASFVGAICTLYFNPQPTVCGAIIGLGLCKSGMFKAPPIKPTP